MHLYLLPGSSEGCKSLRTRKSCTKEIKEPGEAEMSQEKIIDTVPIKKEKLP